MSLKLYDIGPSPNCFKVRLLLAELGLPFEKVEIDLFKGEGQTPAFLDINPNGKLPVLSDGDFILWESNAILKYLATLKYDRGLLPADIKGMAKIDQWLNWQNAHFYPPIVSLAAELIFKAMAGQEPDQEKLADAQKDFARYCTVLEKTLADKEYIVGYLSVVDFALVSNFQLKERLKLDLSAYPNLSRWLENMTARACWQAAQS